MNSKLDPIFNKEEIKFSRLALDQLKEQDLKVLFETLMTEPPLRTIADINALIKILLSVQPVKKLRNYSIIYHLCRSMFIAKFKEKTFIYQRQEEAESLYIILSGKVGLYKRNPDCQDQEEVIFLSEGSSFGHAYKWKQKFLPLTFEETLLAVVPRRELPKIAAKINVEREQMITALVKSKIFGSESEIREISQELTLHRVPFGSHLIKQGEIPKGIFFIMKGNISKHLEMKTTVQDKTVQKREVSVSEFTAGDYFPKESLTECLPFNIVADSPCEVISLPKRCLKAIGWAPPNHSFKGQQYYKSQLTRQKEWQTFKQSFLTTNFPAKSLKTKPMIF